VEGKWKVDGGIAQHCADEKGADEKGADEKGAGEKVAGEKKALFLTRSMSGRGLVFSAPM